jgi:LPS-assembly lipoprotein
LSKLTTLGFTLLLAGCGFHLQGAYTTPPDMERTYISAADNRSLFYRDLREALLSADVQLVDNATDATAVFTISFDHTDQRVLSVSARNVPTEFEVFYTIEYSLDSGTKNLLEPQTVTLTRDYTYDPTLVLGKAHEQELLRDAIVDSLVRIVLKQIDTL